MQQLLTISLNLDISVNTLQVHQMVKNQIATLKKNHITADVTSTKTTKYENPLAPTAPLPS